MLLRVMSDPLRPLKTILGKTWVCMVLAALPVTILEGMRVDREWCDLVRRVDGSESMWILLGVYLLIIGLIWCRWVSRAEPEDR